MSAREKDTLDKMLSDLRSLPDEEGKFVDWVFKAYVNVSAFDPKDYGL